MPTPLDKYRPSTEWHEMRRKTLRGSDATIIADGRPAEILKLWRLKTGRTSPSSSRPNLAMLLGKVTEDLNAAYLEETTGRKVWGRERNIMHPIYEWMGASIDGITTAQDGREAVVEFKFISWDKDINRQYGLRKYEFEDLIRKRKWAEQVTLPLLIDKYSAQCHHNMFVGGWDVCVFCPIIGNQQYAVEIEFNEAYWQRLFQDEKLFWDHVVLDIPPDPCAIGEISY